MAGEIMFEAIPSGDHECFCWAVNKETFIKILGKSPNEELDRNKFHRNYCNVYPVKSFIILEDLIPTAQYAPLC